MRAVHWAALLLVLATMALLLRLMGRPWWCETGDLVPWSGDIWSRHNSQHLVDPYTVTHAMHGLLFYALLVLTLARMAGAATRAAVALGIEVGWEIVENTNTMIERYRETTVSLGYYGDSVLNSVGDVTAFFLGYVAAGVVPAAVSVVAFVVAELVLIVTIRDSLLLNVLMLVHPVEAVKAWQLGG